MFCFSPPSLRCIYPIFSPCLVLHYKKGPAHSFAEMKTLKTLQIAFAKSLQSLEPQFIAPATCGGAAPGSGINHLPACSSWPGLSQGEVNLQQNRTYRSPSSCITLGLAGPNPVSNCTCVQSICSTAVSTAWVEDRGRGEVGRGGR